MKNNEPAPLQSIIAALNVLFKPARSDWSACVNRITTRQYKVLRTSVNQVFTAGEISPFQRKVGASTAFGDVLAVIARSVSERYDGIVSLKDDEFTLCDNSNPPLLTVEERSAWRDALIEALDAMAVI